MDRADEILSRISALETNMNQRFDVLSSAVHKGFKGLEAAILDMCDKK